MPYRSLRECTYPGCTTLVRSGRCDKHSYEKAVKRDPNIKRLYNSKRWRAISKSQLEQYPYCVECYEQGRGLVKASHCDHVTPHGGDVVKFFAGPFQSLCVGCHSRKTRFEEQEVPPYEKVRTSDV